MTTKTTSAQRTTRRSKPEAPAAETKPDPRDEIITIYEGALYALLNNEWLDHSRQLSVWRDNFKAIIREAQQKVDALRQG